ncbi:phage holin family protein [Pseudomonas typographi]|uniref:Phage holin family protein n=1 Tax=Pseudomonas typographi TaxID=2715964 RepID=A0ABR7Z764_9PSED|nr:phage holin family protein [Pseudomonas typographi]MBD1554630.1 phage holin family protein [Pseudomonas typographi]MBD1587165.1 phage holin family protein [Pseudomonas typographi]MBD1601385.1 phage holin family protein [Pseudomonas typographi]
MSVDPFEKPAAPVEPSLDSASIGGLLRQLAREVPQLLSKELALAKAELQQSLNSLKAGTAAVAGGAVVVLAGLIILLLAAVYGLSLYLAPWLAALIVGAVTLIVGAVMLQSGKKQFEPSHFTPDKTLHAMQQDKDTLKRKTL